MKSNVRTFRPSFSLHAGFLHAGFLHAGFLHASFLRAVILGCIAILALLLGCASKGADCDSAAANVAKLARASLQADGEMAPKDSNTSSKTSKAGDRNRQESMLPALKEQLAQTCKTEEWSLRVRDCVANAKTVNELVECDPDGSSPKIPTVPRKGSSETTQKTTPPGTSPAAPTTPAAPTHSDPPAPTSPQ